MFTNYLKVAGRNLLRHKLYSAINVFGLSLGVGGCILVLLFIRYEWSYDSFYKNRDSLFQLLVKTKQPNGEWAIAGVAPPSFAAGLKAEFPEIRYAARFISRGARIRKNGEIFQDVITFTEPEIFSTFDIEFLKGNAATALRNPNEVVVTEEMAKKYFGDEDPMGKALTMQNWRFSQWEDFTVVGVVKTMPVNSTFRWNFFLNFPRTMTSGASNSFNWTVTFFQLKRGASSRAIEQKAGGFLQKFSADLRDFRQGLKGRGVTSTTGAEMQDTRLEFESIKDVHFDSRDLIGNVPRAGLARIAILAGIALLVLAIASINFVTLAIGRFANRAKEVGIRKVRRSTVAGHAPVLGRGVHPLFPCPSAWTCHCRACSSRFQSVFQKPSFFYLSLRPMVRRGADRAASRSGNPRRRIPVVASIEASTDGDSQRHLEDWGKQPSDASTRRVPIWAFHLSDRRCIRYGGAVTLHDK
jgi:putative ABC transport system permease protein